MQFEQTEGLWLHERYEFCLEELAELSGISETQLREWVEEGVLVPIDHQAPQWSFGADRLVTVRLARRLRDELELEPHALALIITLHERIQTLEAQLKALHAKLPVMLR